MEFKGTKENWVNVIIDIADFKQVVVGVDKGKAICHLWFEYSEGITDEIKANALLISKAPEMLDMLIAIVTANDCGLLHKADFKVIEQLIKEATELK
jgi:hypothetical protein